MGKHDLFDAAYRCLMERDPDEKMRLTLEAAAAWREGRLELVGGGEAEPVDEPGRPQRPELVHPRRLPRTAAPPTKTRSYASSWSPYAKVKKGQETGCQSPAVSFGHFLKVYRL